MAIHALKIKGSSMAAINSGLKTADVRVNDRGFAAGDKLVLFAEGCDSAIFTVEVSSVSTLEDIGLPGHVLLGLRDARTFIEDCDTEGVDD
jgi:hypothetical protein